MAVILEGGTQVTRLKEGEPVHQGDLQIWSHFRGDAVSLRVLELNGQASLRNESAEEVLYELETNTGIYLPPQTTLEIEGRKTLISVQCDGSPGNRVTGQPGDLVKVSLADRPMQRTGDRWYRELISAQVTQFVGAIPPGRAPDHYHLYEEVLCILEGEGVMWSGASSTPIATGSCVYLPRGQRHCVENRGPGELRLLGVFYPAGSPAVRYER